MSAVKRKHVASSQSQPSAKKRQRRDSEEHDKRTDTRKSEPTNLESALSKQQPTFPRGGAGPLTLIERKQIVARANRDAAREFDKNDLFGSGKDDVADESSESDLDLQDVDQKQTFAKKKSTKQKKSKTKKEDDSIRIESVSYKKLASGSLLLGRIIDISSRGLTMALPNNLTGFVPLTSISKEFNSILEKALQESDNDESDEENDVVDLHKLFRPGQFLRVVVQDIPEEGDEKTSKRRIDLSIEPDRVNLGLDKDALSQGVTLQAAVVSVEDHGAVVDIGLPGVAAFLPKNAFPEDQKTSGLKPGTVHLCTVQSAKAKAVQLSADLFGTKPAKSATTVDSLLPGTLVEVLLTQISEDGFAGKVMGLIDASADVLHSECFLDKPQFVGKYKIGQRVTGRVIARLFREDTKKLLFSVRDSLVNQDGKLDDRLAISSTIDRAQVCAIVHGLGVYFTLPANARGFAHISRLSDKTVDSLSETTGQFKIGSGHQARILGYNAIDALYNLSLEQSTIAQPFLRLEDVEAAVIAEGMIEKLLVGEHGVRGLLVKLAAGIIGHVSTLHLADTVLKTPEKKFKQGMNVKTRVLSVDLDTRRLELTLKKSLVNSDQPVWREWSDLKTGDSTVGTLIKVDADCAIVQFYNNIKGRLPVSEMSEAYIKDAREHFKSGQVLTVYVLKVDPEKRRLTLTARDPASRIQRPQQSVIAGSMVSGTVFEKSANDVLLRLEGDVIARLPVDHVADGSANKRKSALDKIRVGQKLEDVLVLEVKGRQVMLSNKASLRKAAQDGKLLKSFEGLVEDMIVTGFVSNITADRVFVRFAQGISGVINKPQIPDDQAEETDFGMKVMQPISARVVKIDYSGATPRFWLSMKTSSVPETKSPAPPLSSREIIEAVDENIKSYADLAVGTNIKVRITSVKETQLNVYISKDIQGRVDVSEVYDRIEDIPDRKSPLKNFSSKQIITVKILGQHDSRSYKFLPLSHRTSKNVVFELSARPLVLKNEVPAVLKLADINLGDSYMAFVNNVTDHSLMVNISPAVRGRISDRDVSDDLDVAANLSYHFPIGSVLQATVRAVDVEKNRLDLSAKSGELSRVLTVDNLSIGDIVAGRVTKSTQRTVIIQLSEDLVGAAELVDLADDYDLADPSRFHKGEIVRSFVLQVDKPNKKIYLSLRPSKILSSALNVADPELALERLNVGDIRRGFVANVSDKGVFVTLARGLTAFVRVTNLSDEYLKEWKDHFQRGQLVRGKIVLVDKDSGHVQMSLRESHITGIYKPPITFRDLKVGDVVEARIAKLESFGVFIVVKNSDNVRGLCHRSEIADQHVQDVTKLGFSEGDSVKAKVLKIEPDQRRINFGMKASYFGDDAGGSPEHEMAIDDETDDDAVVSDDEGVQLNDSVLEDRLPSDDDGISIELNDHEVDGPKSHARGLSVGGFDWSGTSTVNQSDKHPIDETDTEIQKPKKKKKKPEILVDRTGDLDRDGPQSVEDFERLLLSEPDNADLWVQFMAFYVDLGDTDAAREVAEKALRTISLSQQDQKRAIWMALLNLELGFGDDETVESTLQRACQTMDPEDIHSRLASLYIQSGNYGKADDLFQTMTKKFTQNPRLWTNYATFLFDQLEDPARARALLPRALQALPPFTHFDITKQFAMLEYKTKTGVPEEGRTRFQGLVNLYPKRLDLFNIMLDLEIKLGDADQVRGVLKQVLSKSLKPAKAKPFFKRWLEFEEAVGDEDRVEEVKERAAKYVAQQRREE